MPGEIIVNPTSLALANGIEGVLQVGGTVSTTGRVDFFEIEEFEVQGVPDFSASESLRKLSGASAVKLISLYEIPRGTPFSIRGAVSPEPEYDGFPSGITVGVINPFGQWSYISYSRQAITGTRKFGVTHNSVTVVAETNGLQTDAYMVQSDGFTLSFLRRINGVYSTLYQVPIPTSIPWYKFFWYFPIGGVWSEVSHSLNAVSIPVSTGNITAEDVPDGTLAIRAIDGSRFGVIGNAVGDFIVRLRHSIVTDVSKDVPVHVDALYLRPVGKPCGSFIIQGNVVQFETNGGTGGIFTADGGTILSGLRWQAPFTEGQITLSYQVGSITATCVVNVVKKLEVLGVQEDGYYPDLAQDEGVIFHSTCPNAIFTSPSHPSLITTSGILIAPTDAKDEVFGEKNVTVKVEGCGQVYTFGIRIQPMYPLEQFCGPTPIKWLQKVRDYLPNRLTMTGGTSQVKNRNKEGILLWDVNYDNLIAHFDLLNCTCTPDSPNAQCPQNLASAARLDDFYNQVKQVHYFTIIDYHTGIRYKYVRLIKYDNNHDVFRYQQARTLTMRFEGEPLFPGLPTIPSSNEPPTTPLNPTVGQYDVGNLIFTWDASSHPNGILGYQVQVDNEAPVLVGNQLFYIYPSVPAAGHLFRVRAISNNVTFSPFTPQIAGVLPLPPLLEDLFAYWKQNEAASADGIDSIGINTLTQVGGVGSAGGHIDVARTYDLTKWFTLASNADVQMGDEDFTYVGWVKLAGLGVYYGIFGKQVLGGSDPEYYSYLDQPTGKILWGVHGASGGGSGTTLLSAQTVSASVFFFVAYQHDSVNNKIKLQVNGSTIAEASHSAGVYAGTGTFTLGFNRVPPGNNLSLDGATDEWAGFHKVLDIDELQFLYNHGYGRPLDQYNQWNPNSIKRLMVCSYELNEGGGDAIDSHGEGGDLTAGSPIGTLNGGRDFEVSTSLNRFLIANKPEFQMRDNDFTIEVWVNLESKTDPFYSLVNKDDCGAANIEYRVSWGGTGNDRFLFGVTANGVNDAFASSVSANSYGVPPIGQWIQIFAWHDSVANQIRIQVNNGAIDSTAHSAGVFHGASGFELGGWCGSRFDGQMKRARIWKRVLSAEEKTWLWNGGNGRAYTEMI